MSLMLEIQEFSFFFIVGNILCVLISPLQFFYLKKKRKIKKCFGNLLIDNQFDHYLFGFLLLFILFINAVSKFVYKLFQTI